MNHDFLIIASFSRREFQIQSTGGEFTKFSKKKKLSLLPSSIHPKLNFEKLPLGNRDLKFVLNKKKKKNQSFQLIISIYPHSLSILFNRKGRNRLTSALRKKIINSGMIQLTRPSFLNCFTHRCIRDIPNYHETIKPPEHTFSLIR